MPTFWLNVVTFNTEIENWLLGFSLWQSRFSYSFSRIMVQILFKTQNKYKNITSFTSPTFCWFISIYKNKILYFGYIPRAKLVCMWLYSIKFLWQDLNDSFTHLRPMFRIRQEPVDWFAMQIKWLGYICYVTLVLNW